MKNTSKLIGIVLALIVVILAVFLVTKFNSHESARVSTSSSPAKTVKKSSSSSSKAVKKDKKSTQSSSSAVSNEENGNQASAVAPKASSKNKLKQALQMVGKRLKLDRKSVVQGKSVKISVDLVAGFEIGRAHV